MEKSMPSSKKDINQQLRDTIYKKVTKKTHSNQSPKKNGDGTIAKCIELFNKGADPNVLIQLEKSLREQEKYQKYYNYYTEKFLPALEVEITNSKKLTTAKRTEIEKIIMELITLDVVSKSSSVSSIPSAVKENIEDQMQLGHIEEQNNTQETPLNIAEKKSGDNKILSNLGITEEILEKDSKVVEEIKEHKQTSELSNDNDSDSRIDSPRKSEESLELPVRSSISSTEEDSNPQKAETENKVLLEQTTEKKPAQVSYQCVTLGSKKKENMDPSGQATQRTGSQPVKSEEQKDKKNTIITMQKPPVNEKKGEDTPLKQPNNRNLHVALVAGCALSTIGCIVAGAMTSGLVGAGLLAMAAVFAIAAVAELHSNFLSSKLTSINVEPLVDDKKLTACSHL